MSSFRVAALATSLLLTCVASAQPVPDVSVSNGTAPPFWTPAAAESPAVTPGAVRGSRSALVTATPLPFVGINPCRQYDSRSSTVLVQNTPRTVTLVGAPCGIPATAQAAAVNITIFNIIGAASNGVFSVGTASPPTTAWINYPPTETQRANAGVVGLTVAGEIVVQVNQVAGFVDFVVDVFGYYAPSGIVNSLNALNGDVTLSAGTDLTLSPLGQTLTLGANSSSANAVNTLVRRDSSGSFSATLVTANVIGNVSGAASANVLKTGDTMTGTLALSSGNINLVTEPSTAASGNILKNGERFLHDAGGVFNTFVGQDAGNFTMAGFANMGSGAFALGGNGTGSGNTASGYEALFGNTQGDHNTGIGLSALVMNSTGNSNTALGSNALSGNTGSSNTGVGSGAGAALTTGHNNIDIGNQGVAAESNTIRIGDVATHTATYIAGISGATAAGGVAVFVDASGHLGTVTSSKRFKDDIHDMGPASQRLLKLIESQRIEIDDLKARLERLETRLPAMR